jgi:hypothetical protein
MTTPLGEIDIDWSEYEQSFSTPGSGRSATAPRHISRLFNWTDVDKRGNTKRIGAQFRHMFYTKLDIADREEWQFERPLGRGGFGAAALFQKRDADQKVIDVSTYRTTHLSR